MINFLATSAIFQTIKDNFHSLNYLLNFSICTALILIVSLFIAIKTKRLFTSLFYVFIDLVFIISLIFSLDMVSITSLVLYAIMSIIFSFINSGILRKYVATPLKNYHTDKKVKNGKYDIEKLIRDVTTATKWLSTNKVGALMTFEKKQPLDDFLKNGITINAPFSPELVETIFFEGTRLHDGAIVIRDNMIVAATVMYPASNKILLGKVGARHRAALGISEVTDSITVVVSEETGSISIAHGGMLDTIKTDEFERVFRNQIAE